MYVCNEFGSPLQKSLYPFHYDRVLLGELRGDDTSGAKRQEADQRPDFDARRAPVRKPQDVVEEAVLVIPQLVLILSYAIHRAGNPEEMLDELVDQALVRRIA